MRINYIFIRASLSQAGIHIFVLVKGCGKLVHKLQNYLVSCTFSRRLFFFSQRLQPHFQTLFFINKVFAYIQYVLYTHLQRCITCQMPFCWSGNTGSMSMSTFSMMNTVFVYLPLLAPEPSKPWSLRCKISWRRTTVLMGAGLRVLQLHYGKREKARWNLDMAISSIERVPPEAPHFFPPVPIRKWGLLWVFLSTTQTRK